MDLIEQELDAKTIEKLKEDAISIEEKEEPPPAQSPEPKPAVKKTKKVRSEAQKAAFEKARLKRAEKVAERKKLKEEEKQQKKETRKIIKKKVKEEVEKEYHTEGELDDFLIHRDDDEEEIQETSTGGLPLGPKHDPTASAGPALVRQKSRAPKKASVSAPERDPVVNNYYYYGNMAPVHPPHQYTEEPEKKSRKKKPRARRPPTPSSSSEEDDFEPQPEPAPVYEEEPIYQPSTNSRMKFNYA